MSETKHQTRRRALGLAAAMACAIAIGVTGCSDDDDNGDAATGASAATTTGPNLDPPARRDGPEDISHARGMELADKDNEVLNTGSSVERTVEEGIEDIQIGIAEVGGQSVCHELAPIAQVAMARTIGKSKPLDCAEAVVAAADRRRKAGGTTPLSEVLSVDVRGDRALARTEYPGGTVRLIPFVEVDGQLWRTLSLEMIDPALIERPLKGHGHDYSDPPGLKGRAQIEEVLYDVEGDFPLELGNSVCFELTPEGQREVGGGVTTCNQRLPEIVRKALRKGYEPHYSSFRSIDIRGRHAVAVVKSPGRPARTVRFTKMGEDGWKLDSVRYAGNIDPAILREPLKKAGVGVAVDVPRHDLGDSGGGPRAEIREVVSDIQVDFAEGIGGVCPELSSRGERELAGRPGLAACTAVASELSRRVRSSRTLVPWESRVLSVAIDGRRATAVLATRGRGRHRALFVDEPNKGWRLESLRYVEPVAGLIGR